MITHDMDNMIFLGIEFAVDMPGRFSALASHGEDQK
jgi:hypothetical protein